MLVGINEIITLRKSYKKRRASKNDINVLKKEHFKKKRWEILYIYQ